MDKNMIAYCGAYCETCQWKDKTNCPGCKACESEMFWGKCDKATCCMEKGYDHCGLCSELPCDMMKSLFEDKEHGDDGMRMRNLNNWAKGNYIFMTLVS